MDKKLLLWFVASSLISSISLLYNIHISDPNLPSYEIAGHPLVILMLCFVFGWTKKDKVLEQMSHNVLPADPTYRYIGLLICVIALFLPLSYNLAFVIFKVLLIFIGVFIIFYGAAASLPAILVFVYGFSISFPIVLDALAGDAFALLTTRIVSGVAGLFFSVGYEGQVLHVLNIEGNRNYYYIDAGCSGSASLAIFLTVFALMLIDIRPPSKYLFPLFLFGLAGTSFQNVLRLVFLLAVSYFYGSSATWTMHEYAGYIIFPVWFAIFVYVYLKTVVHTRSMER